MSFFFRSPRFKSMLARMTRTSPMRMKSTVFGGSMMSSMQSLLGCDVLRSLYTTFQKRFYSESIYFFDISIDTEPRQWYIHSVIVR